jgi:hypothetical protein
VPIDTHVHVVSPNRDGYPVLENSPAWPAVTGNGLIARWRFTASSARCSLRAFSAIVSTTAMPSTAPPPIQTASRSCVIDQTAPSAAETLSRLVREHGVRGIQLTSMDMPHGVLWDPRTFPVWERAAEAGIPVASRPGSRIGYVHGTSAVLERFRPYADTLGNAPSPPTSSPCRP